MPKLRPMPFHSQRLLRRGLTGRAPRLGAAALICGLALLNAAPVARARGLTEDVPMAQLSRLDLEELMEIEVESVYGASKYLQKSTEAPASVTVITSDELRQGGYRTLADALRAVRGFYITSDRNYDYVAVRGFGRVEDYNARVLLLVDGHRVNDNLYEAAMLGTEFPVDVELIERIEVVRGPSSAIYGSNSFLGVVNVITRHGKGWHGLEAAGSLGTLNSGKARASYGAAVPGGAELLVSGSLFSSDGQRRLYFKELDSPAMNDGVSLRGDADRSEQALANVTYRDFTLQALYGLRAKHVPTGSWGTLLNDRRNRTQDVRGWLDLSWRHDFDGRLMLMGRLAYDSYDFDGGYVYDYSETDTPLVVLNQDRSRGRWWGAEFIARKPDLGRHNLLAGSEIRRNVTQDQINFDRDPFALPLDDHWSSTIWALYGEDEVRVGRRLLFTLGLRHDHYPRFGSSTNPRFGFSLTPVAGTTAKLL